MLLSYLVLPPTSVSVCKCTHLSHLVPVFTDDRSGWPIRPKSFQVSYTGPISRWIQIELSRNVHSIFIPPSLYIKRCQQWICCLTGTLLNEQFSYVYVVQIFSTTSPFSLILRQDRVWWAALSEFANSHGLVLAVGHWAPLPTQHFTWHPDRQHMLCDSELDKNKTHCHMAPDWEIGYRSE